MNLFLILLKINKKYKTFKQIKINIQVIKNKNK